MNILLWRIISNKLRIRYGSGKISVFEEVCKRWRNDAAKTVSLHNQFIAVTLSILPLLVIIARMSLQLEPYCISHRYPRLLISVFWVLLSLTSQRDCLYNSGLAQWLHWTWVRATVSSCVLLSWQFNYSMRFRWQEHLFRLSSPLDRPLAVYQQLRSSWKTSGSLWNRQRTQTHLFRRVRW